MTVYVTVTVVCPMFVFREKEGLILSVGVLPSVYAVLYCTV